MVPKFPRRKTWTHELAAWEKAAVFSGTSGEVLAPRPTALVSPSHTVPDMALVVAEVRDAACPRCGTDPWDSSWELLCGGGKSSRTEWGTCCSACMAMECAWKKELWMLSFGNPCHGMAQTLRGNHPFCSCCLPKSSCMPSTSWQGSSHAGTQSRGCGNGGKEAMGNEDVVVSEISKHLEWGEPSRCSQYISRSPEGKIPLESARAFMNPS